MQIKKLLLYGILLTLIPFSAKAIQLSIDELRDLFSGQEQELGASLIYPYMGGTGQGTVAAGDVGKYLKVSGNSPFTYSFDTPAGGSGTGGGSSIWSTTTPMTIYYNQEGYPLVIGNNATSSDGTIFEVVGNSYFDGTLKVGEYTFPSSDGTNGYTLKTNGSGTLTWQEDTGSMTALPNTQIYVGNASNEATATSAITVLSTGNVGIGTTNPQSKLEVVGNDRVITLVADLATSATTGRAFNIFASGESSWRTVFYSDGKIGIGPGNATRDIFLSRSAANTFKIAGSFDGATDGNLIITGNVGIGTTNPAYELDVNGDLSITGSYYGIKDEMVKMNIIAGATYTNTEDWWNVTQSAGKINSGGELSDNGDGTITILAGYGIIKTTNSSIGNNVSIDMPENSSLGISQDEINYVYADYNGGSPIFATTTSRASINGRTKVAIGMAYNDGTKIHTLSGGAQIQDLAFRTHRRAEELYSFARASGLITSEIGARGLTMTSGVFYRGNTRFTSTASSSITFTTWYNDGAWQKTTGQTTISNTQYNDYGTGLATIAPNKYGVYYIYRDFDGDFYLVYGIGSYTLAEAKALGSPDNLPDLVSSFSMLLAKVIVEKDDTNFTEIQIPWDIQFSGQTTTSYDDLSDLPDLTVYAELAQNDTITGNWVNTINPWANDEVSDDLTVNGYMQDTDIDTFAKLQSWAVGYTDNDTTYTAGTGLTLTTGTFSVDTSQNITTLSNLTDNGFVKTSGGTGALSIDTSTYLTTVDISANTNLAVTAPVVLTDDTLSVSASSDTASGIVELATTAETTTGTDTGRAITPDGLAGSSIFGRKTIELIPIAFDADTETADGIFYFHIPASLNGMNLVSVHGLVVTAGTTGTTDWQLYNLTDSQDMLSTKLTIDTTETGSNTAATPAVINTSYDDVATNDVIRLDCDAISTTAAKGTIISLSFQLP